MSISLLSIILNYIITLGIKFNDINKITKSLSNFDDIKIPYRQPKVSILYINYYHF